MHTGELEADYTLLRELGRGATTVVHLARHRTTGREVAVKIAPPGEGEAGTADVLALCAHEALTLARLDHPNIVRHYGLYVTRDGGRALVLQYVVGETLRERLLREPRPPYETVESVLRDIGGALAHAHAHGVVHRDVKPENILLDAAHGRAFLSDFGIAGSLLAGGHHASAELVTGTPRYMPPEQINGDPPDARSDLYSLGLVGWEMLAGERPWAGETLDELLFSQCNEALADLRTLRSDAPPRLVLAIEAALHKDRSLRLASADEFLTQLASDSPVGGTAQSRLFIRRPALPVADLGTTLPATPVDTESQTVAFQRREPERPVRAPPPSHPASARARRRWLAELAVASLLGAGIAAGLIAFVKRSSGRPEPLRRPVITSSAVAAMPSRSATPTRGTPAPARAPGPLPAPARALSRPVAASPAPAARRPSAPPVVSRGVAASPTPPRAVARSDGVRVDAARSARRLTDAALGAYAGAVAPAGGGTGGRAAASLRQARALLDSAAAIRTADADVYLLRARVALALGDLRAAWSDAEMAGRLGRAWEAQAVTSVVDVANRDTAGARARAAALLQRARQRGTAVTADQGRYLALAFMALGDRARAVEAIQRITPSGAAGAQSALRDPGLATLRNDPRLSARRLRGRR